MAKVLVTDDAVFMRKVLTDLLQNAGYECVEAANGEEMLKVYESENPDVVTLDITMPVMDGVTALKALKEKHADANVVMVSAMGQQAMVVDAVVAGAKDFIVKPFDKDKVLSAIAGIVE